MFVKLINSSLYSDLIYVNKVARFFRDNKKYDKFVLQCFRIKFTWKIIHNLRVTFC